MGGPRQESVLYSKRPYERVSGGYSSNLRKRIGSNFYRFNLPVSGVIWVDGIRGGDPQWSSETLTAILKSIMSTSHDTSKNPFGPPDRWFILSLVAFDYFVLYLHRAVLGFIQPPLKLELGLSDEQIGWLQPAFVIPYALSQLFVAYWSDRFQRRTILISSLSGSVICLAAMGWASTFEQLVILRVCLGLAQSASVPAIAGIMADCFTPKNRSTAVSVYLISYLSAVFIAGFWGGTIAEVPLWSLPFGADTLTLGGWRLALIGFSLIGAITVVVLMFLLREPERTERNTEAGLGNAGSNWFQTVCSVVTTPSFLVLATIFFLFSIVTNTREYWLARYFHDSFGMGLKEAGTFSTIWIQPAQFVGMLVGGLWADQWARRWQGGRSAVSAVGMLVWIPALFVIGTSDSRIFLPMAMIAFGWGLGVYTTNIWTTMFDVVDPAARSTAAGLLNVFAAAPGLAGPIVGRLKDHGTIEHFGTVFAWLSVPATAIVLLHAVYIWVTLPRDFRGSEPST